MPAQTRRFYQNTSFNVKVFPSNKLQSLLYKSQLLHFQNLQSRHCTGCSWILTAIGKCIQSTNTNKAATPHLQGAWQNRTVRPHVTEKLLAFISLWTSQVKTITKTCSYTAIPFLETATRNTYASATAWFPYRPVPENFQPYALIIQRDDSPKWNHWHHSLA